MKEIIIKSSGYYLPENVISNEELVSSFNKYINTNMKQKNNVKRVPCMTSQDEALGSDSDFIYSASGIKKRYVLNKSGILNINRMKPLFEKRDVEKLSIQAEFAVNAAEIALRNARKRPTDIDGIIVSCSGFQRPYPGIAIEVQNYLGASGWAFDMNAACSSATFGIASAFNSISSGMARAILVICPEIYTAYLNYKDRRSHFIFGDGSAAVLLEEKQGNYSNIGFKILSASLSTKFSNNIRCNLGFLSHCEANFVQSDHYFIQNGKNVREEVVPLAINHIQSHLQQSGINSNDISRLWLHQANKHMNIEIANAIKKTNDLSHFSPIILEELGNTGAAGSLIAFNKFSDDMEVGEIGVFSTFGAGYTLGSLILQKV